MPKNLILHTRITDDTHSKLTSKCSEIGCNMTDYVISVLEDSFDQEPKEEPKPTIEIIPELQNVIVEDV